MRLRKEEEGQPDRRASPRNPVLVCEARQISGIEVFFGHATNVSSSGMFIVTAKMRTPGSEYEVQFRLPGVDHLFRCHVRVIWTRPYRHASSLSPGFGLHFLDLPEEDRRCIDEWLHAANERL